MLNWRAGAIAALAGVVVVAAGQTVIAQDKMKSMPMAFGGSSDVAFAKQLWSSMSNYGLVGEKRINVQPFEGNEPHGAIQQVLERQIKVGKRTGRVIVKVNHMAKDVKSVYAEPNKFIGAYTVMFKKPAGYDSENKDWFWAKYKPNGEIDTNEMGMMLAGRVAKGMDQGCIACHRSIGGDDLEILR